LNEGGLTENWYTSNPCCWTRTSWWL